MDSQALGKGLLGEAERPPPGGQAMPFDCHPRLSTACRHRLALPARRPHAWCPAIARPVLGAQMTVAGCVQGTTSPMAGQQQGGTTNGTAEPKKRSMADHPLDRLESRRG